MNKDTSSMKIFHVFVDSGYSFEYHSLIVAKNVKEARIQFIEANKGTPVLWNGSKSFKIRKA